MLLSGIFLCSSAYAQTTILTSPADFSGSEQVVDFEGLGPDGSPVPIADGVLFSLTPGGDAPLFFNDVTPTEFGPAGDGSIDDDVASGATSFRDLIITFPGPVNRMGFEMRSLANDEITLTVHCLNEGVIVDSFSFPPPGVLGLPYRFYAFETAGTFDEVMIDPEEAIGNGAWRLDNLRFELTSQVYGCVGFDAPADGGAIKVKKNRVIPLKAQLVDSLGMPLTDADVTSPPVVQVLFSPAVAGGAVDVSGDALSAGQGSDGNAFEFSDDQWRFNLKTKNYSAKGTYTVSMISGDSAEYIVDPSCTVQFVID